jgi:preprotein translocase subunit SecD
MNGNVGPADRAVRVVIAMLIAVVLLSGSVEGFVAIALAAGALILLLTSVLGYCLVYALLNIRTEKRK